MMYRAHSLDWENNKIPFSFFLKPGFTHLQRLMSEKIFCPISNHGKGVPLPIWPNFTFNIETISVLHMQYNLK